MNLGIKSDESGILSQIVWISTLLNLDLLIRGPPKITHIHMHAYSTLHYITSHSKSIAPVSALLNKCDNKATYQVER